MVFGVDGGYDDDEGAFDGEERHGRRIAFIVMLPHILGVLLAFSSIRFSAHFSPALLTRELMFDDWDDDDLNLDEIFGKTQDGPPPHVIATRFERNETAGLLICGS